MVKEKVSFLASHTFFVGTFAPVACCTDALVPTAPGCWNYGIQLTSISSGIHPLAGGSTRHPCTGGLGLSYICIYICVCKWINNLSKAHLVGGFNRSSWTKCCMLIKMAEHHNIIPKLVGISRKTTKNIQNYLQAVGMPKWSHFFSAFIGGEWGIGQIFGIPRDEDQSSGLRILKKSALGNQHLQRPKMVGPKWFSFLSKP